MLNGSEAIAGCNPLRPLHGGAPPIPTTLKTLVIADSAAIAQSVKIAARHAAGFTRDIYSRSPSVPSASARKASAEGSSTAPKC
jgi:hypothetical protein